MTLQANGEKSVALPRTAYLGPEASFSHQAVVEALPDTQPIPLPSFKAILSALQNSERDGQEAFEYAVLPVENSTNGSVVQALDLLAQCRLDAESSTFPDVEAIDEHYLEVHHYLFVARAWAEQRLAKEDLDSLESNPKQQLDRKRLEQLLAKLNIRTLYTHPQVWGQCNTILSSLLPPGHVDRVDMSSTSAAAAYVASHAFNVQDGEVESGIAAIASSLAGAKHRGQLICLAQNIEDDPGANTTRFLVLANQKKVRKGLSISGTAGKIVQIKSLWTFTIAHRIPGSLAKALAVFATHGFNLSAIQSRPKPKPSVSIETLADKRTQNVQLSNWQYVFFVECLHSRPEALATREDGELNSLLEDLRNVTERLSLIGNWDDRLSIEMV